MKKQIIAWAGLLFVGTVLLVTVAAVPQSNHKLKIGTILTGVSFLGVSLICFGGGFSGNREERDHDPIC